MSRQDPDQPIDASRRQYQLCMRSFAPFEAFGGFGVADFEGDNRSFSTSPDVTYRTGGFLVFDVDSGDVVVPPVGRSSGTKFHDSDEEPDTAEVSAEVESKDGEPGRLTFVFKTAGANPKIDFAPDIDLKLLFVTFLLDSTLHLAGKLVGDGFPSAEVFIRDSRGNPLLLHTFGTEHSAKAGPVTLIGDGTDDMGHFSVGVMLDRDVCFIGSVPFGA